MAQLLTLARTGLSGFFAWWLADPQIMEFAAFMAVVIWLKHAGNIRRLVRGQETKIGKKSRSDSARQPDRQIEILALVPKLDACASIAAETRQLLPQGPRHRTDQGACHGAPQGKNGFRLSLRGFDPTVDIYTLTREALGRRTSGSFPERSLTRFTSR